MDTKLMAPTAFSSLPANDAVAISNCRDRMLVGLYFEPAGECSNTEKFELHQRIAWGLTNKPGLLPKQQM
jgi:hypothetical protein